MKPYHVLIFIGSIFVLLLALTWFQPEGGYSLGFTSFKVLKKEKLISTKEKGYVNIDKLIAQVDTTVTSGGAVKKEPINDKNIDSSFMFLPKNELEQWAFFKYKLLHAQNKGENVHIIHYGDSQIEGDRMSGFIRERLQQAYGGNGPGLIPVNNVYPTVTYKQTYSENFQRLTCFGNDRLAEENYGVLGSAARFTSPAFDTMHIDALKMSNAYVEIEPSSKAYPLSRTYTRTTIFLDVDKAPCLLTIKDVDDVVYRDTLYPSDHYQKVSQTFNQTPKKLRFEFQSKISPVVMAIGLEGKGGVQLDNAAMRGSSGTIFGYMDHKTLMRMYDEVNTGMVIMQFGGNAVPVFKDSAHVTKFANYFSGQLNALKRLAPGIPIFVIGPSDMSLPIDGDFETYPLLTFWIEELKRICAYKHVAYFDLFNAMGGKNSMPLWVEKGLAAKDYIHFSNKGARFAAQLFYEALEDKLNTIEAKTPN